MNGKRAKWLRKLAEVLGDHYPEKTEKQWYKQLKKDRKRDKL
jgi:hypothetical protein